MEAALRTVYAVVTGENLQSLDVTPVRGLDGVKEAALEVGELGKVKVAVAHGMANARKILDRIRSGEADWAFIEFMTCPGGCIAGGGEPIPTTNEIRTLRSQALYEDDSEVQEHRQSHENASIRKAYETFLGQPNGELSHRLLHTHYTKRGTELPHKDVKLGGTEMPEHHAENLEQRVH